MPKSLLDNARLFMANEPGQPHIYGIDGPITTWLQDWNGNGRIEIASTDNNKDGQVNAADNDKAYIFFGLRRGGNVYYALDVSKPDSPMLLWKKENTEADDGAWDELGEAWSKPALAKMRIGSNASSTLKTVLVFGGGYDPVKDEEDVNNRMADSMGRDVFIVDAEEGTLIWSLKRDVFNSNEDLNPVKHSIPGDIRVMDMDRNGALDRLYFADTGGNVWRVDMDHDLRDTDESLYDYGDAILTKMADLAFGGADAQESTGNTTDPRKFFYEPDTALLQHNGQSLLTISLGSGYRTHPMNATVDDRFYVLLDPNVYNEPPEDWAALTDADLTNRTDAGLTDTNNLLHGLHKGWYYDFALKGEKVLASAVTFLNKVVFTTFAPVDEDGNEPSDDPCDTPPNSSRAYVLDLLTGKAVANLDRSTDDSKDDFVVAGINEILNSAQIIFRSPSYTTAADGSISCGEDNCAQTVEIRVGKMSMPLMDESNSDNSASASVSSKTDLSDIIPRIFWRDNSVSDNP